MSTVIDTAAIAAQLACPHGERATDFSRSMLFRNLPVYQTAYQCLNPQANHKILEIGYGNGGLLGTILSLAPNVHYTGLEMSPAMHEDACRFNQAYIEAGMADYCLSLDGSLPFPAQHFDRILTVNTIYFWSDPKAVLAEIAHSLKPQGQFCLTFGEKTFMQSLAFTQHGFRLYTPSEIEALTTDLPLRLINTITHRDCAVGLGNILIDRVCLNMLFEKTS